MDADDPRSPPPLTPWAPPPDGSPAGPGERFFKGVAPENLGVGDAISTGFRVLTKPTFFLPVFAISVIVTLTVEVALGPILRDRLALTAGGLQSRLPLLLSSAVVVIIGSMLAAAYGQVWLVLATSAGEPSIGDAIRKTLERWLAVLAAGVVAGLVLIVTTLPAFVLVIVSRGEPVVFLLAVPIFAYVGSRLGMATWLAAAGLGPIASVRESWQMTSGQVLRIIGWNLALAVVIGIVGLVLGLVLNRFTVGAAISEGITIAVQFGAGVALFRKVEAASAGGHERDQRGYLR